MATIDSLREAAYRDRNTPITKIDRKRCLNVLYDFYIDVGKEGIPREIKTLGELEKWQRGLIKKALGFTA